MENLLTLQSRQLSRLLETNKNMEIETAFYIIFSDNLSPKQVLELISANYNSECFDENLHFILNKHLVKIK